MIYFPDDHYLDWIISVVLYLIHFVFLYCMYMCTPILNTILFKIDITVMIWHCNYKEAIYLEKTKDSNSSKL